MKYLLKVFPIIFFIGLVFFFFKPFIFEEKLPIPSDTIVGLYHPFRDLYVKDYPNGIPFKNFLITDPVRQQYPWRELAINVIKKGELPLWNPYSMAGYPLLGNQQSALLYPLNIIFFILPFPLAWGSLILLQPLLAGIFLYFYLRNLKLNRWASLLGSLAFAFSGFSIAWMEWGTVLHVGLWLPLILLSIDKILPALSRQKIFNFQFSIFKWVIVFVFSLVSSFFAGHLQTFFYVFVTSVGYFLVRWWQHGRDMRLLILFTIYYLLFTILAAIQWFPTLQLIFESARDIDRANWQQAGWFIPWQHLAQFVAPDFFGNPTTLNYWGVWNYGEFIGYIGILPLLMAFFALFQRRDKKTLFFGAIFFLSLIFALPTILAKPPYILNIPFLSTAQPTRLLFLSNFSLAILAALGFDLFLKDKKRIWYAIAIIGVVLVALWIVVFWGGKIISQENVLVVNRNLRLPTVIFVGTSILIFLKGRLKRKMIQIILLAGLVGITAFDLLRFGFKFTPFTNQEYLFPSTKVIEFLQKEEGQFRIMATDSRIFPPNFSTVYRIQTIDGYDPLYLRRFGELIAASERGEPNISPPFGFNRIITPKNFESKIIDLLGVKYVLSLTDLNSAKLVKVFQEGQTRVYENKDALSRSFFAENIKWVGTNDEAIRAMFDDDFDPRRTAVVENTKGGESVPPLRWNTLDASGRAEIIHYSENRIIVRTENEGDGFLVLTDSFYPTWRVTIDNSSNTIYRTNYNFRGVTVPRGEHTVVFYTTLL